MTSSLLFPVLLVVMVLLHHSSSSHATVEEECKLVSGNPSPTYDFCVSTLQVVPSAPTADTAGLASISADLSISNATTTKAKIQQLLVGSAPAVKMALQDCLDSYDEIIENSKSAGEAVKAKSYDDANAKISAAMSFVDSCNEGFEESGSTSPIGKENEDENNLLTLTLDFVAKLQKLK